LLASGGRANPRASLPLAPRLLQEHDRVNVIQHPDGKPPKVVMTENYVVKTMADTRAPHVADTRVVSSRAPGVRWVAERAGDHAGSPVCTRAGGGVPLQHSGEPYPPEAPDPDKPWRG